MDHLCIYFLDILRAYKYIIIFKLKLKLQYFGHLMRRVDSLEKTHAGRDWGQEEKGTTGWDGWMASLTRWTRVWVNSGSWWWIARPGVLRFMGSQRVVHDWATELNWGEKWLVYSDWTLIFQEAFILSKNLRSPINLFTRLPSLLTVITCIAV